MKINENEIASSEPFGILDGKQVSLVKTKGGLNLATLDDAVLGAASHQAILCYSIEQRFPSFQPMVMKSEGSKLNAESHSHFLTEDLRKSGHDIYSIQNGNDIQFYITQQNIKINSVHSSIQDNFLIVDPTNLTKEHVSAMSFAISEKALSSGLGVKVK